MSIIVGIEHEGKVYMGADSCASTDSETRIRRDPKIFKNKHTIIGFCGGIAMGQMLKPEFWTPPTDINKLINSIREELIKRDSIGKASDGYEFIATQYMIAFKKGRKSILYEFEADLHIAEFVDGYSAIGDASHFALGSLYSTKKYKSPEKRIQVALECCEYYSPSVKGPFHCFSI